MQSAACYLSREVSSVYFPRPRKLGKPIPIGGLALPLTLMERSAQHQQSSSSDLLPTHCYYHKVKEAKSMVYPQTVHRTIAITTPPSAVWQALTNPDIAKEWLSPDKTSTVTSEWKVGSPIVYAGTWDRRKYLDKGTILQLDPEKTFQYNMWSKLSRLPDTPENYTVVGFTLTPSETGTTLTLTHINFQSYAIYGHANFYWATALDRIKKLLEK